MKTVQTDTFFTDKLCADLESNKGLKECEEEYLVMPQPEALVAKPAWNNVGLMRGELLVRERNEIMM